MATSSDQFGDVSAGVLHQHAEIRECLHDLDVRGGPLPPEAEAVRLRKALLRMASQFERHLAFDEEELAPWVRDVDAWGPCREAAMLADHGEQRRRLREVCAMAEASGVEDLDFAREVAKLLVCILEDMAREERQLSLLGWLYDYGAEQMTG